MNKEEVTPPFEGARRCDYGRLTRHGNCRAYEDTPAWFHRWTDDGSAIVEDDYGRVITVEANKIHFNKKQP